MRRLLAVPFLLLATVAPPARAQATDEAAINGVIATLWEGMRTRDTVLLAAQFDPAARMYGLARDGAVRVSTPSEWFQGILRGPAGVELRERSWDHEVRVDGGIAAVWAKYDFHVGERFSHCGVDAFHFAKVGGTWKVTAIIDSRRQQDCWTPTR
jgi:hypothetical protein